MLRTRLNSFGERLSPSLNVTVLPVDVYTVPHIFSGFCCVDVEIGKVVPDTSVVEERLECTIINMSEIMAELQLMVCPRNILNKIV